ncbi:MAG: serine hydrolase [Cyanobacteria bacterium J06639_16]
MKSGSSQMVHYWLKTATKTLVLTIGVITVRAPFALAPLTIETHPILTQLEQAQSVSEVATIYHDLQATWQAEGGTLRHSQDLQLLAPYWSKRQLVHHVAIKLNQEQQAEAVYNQAFKLATTANEYRQTRSGGNVALVGLNQEARFWRQAIARLNLIPSESVLADQAQAKGVTYRQILAAIATQVDSVEQSAFNHIAAQLPNPAALHLTLCPVEAGDCRDYQGDVPPASPASLIKIPLAITLMDKVAQQGIDLSTPLPIHPYNYTETAENSVSVNHQYALRQVMASMVKHSNNIAANELIDYLGWDFVAQRLQVRGYDATTVRSKLVGDATYPSHNLGMGANRITTNELTQMVRQIYQFQRPQDAALLVALAGQSNPDFGQRAIAQLNNPRVIWIGEKWGQNAKVIGTTVVFRIDQQRYVLTVALDHSGNLARLRQVIQFVIQQTLDTENSPMAV